MWKCRGKFVGEKCEHFFRPNVCIDSVVSSTFGQSDGCMSDTGDNGRTFRCRKGHTKVLQIVFRDADMTRGVLQT